MLLNNREMEADCDVEMIRLIVEGRLSILAIHGG